MSIGKITVAMFLWSMSKEIRETQNKGKGREKNHSCLRTNQNVKRQNNCFMGEVKTGLVFLAS